MNHSDAFNNQEPFYKWYYRHSSPLKKIQLRWNWFRTEVSIIKRTVRHKLKHGAFFNPNDGLN